MADDSYWGRACGRIDAEFGLLSAEARGTLKSILDGGMRDAYERGRAEAAPADGAATAPLDAAAGLASLNRVLDAARRVRLWHDRGEGMVVGAEHVRALGERISEHDALRGGAPDAPRHLLVPERTLEAAAALLELAGADHPDIRTGAGRLEARLVALRLVAHSEAPRGAGPAPVGALRVAEVARLRLLLARARDGLDAIRTGDGRADDAITAGLLMDLGDELGRIRDRAPAPAAGGEAQEDIFAATLTLLEEAISMCRKEGVAGQHVGAMCSARDDLRALAGLARDLLDGEPCDPDSHGHCRAHGWTVPGRACPHARARGLGLVRGGGRDG